MVLLYNKRLRSKFFKLIIITVFLNAIKMKFFYIFSTNRLVIKMLMIFKKNIVLANYCVISHRIYIRITKKQILKKFVLMYNRHYIKPM